MKVLFFSIPTSLKIFHTVYWNKHPNGAKVVARGPWENFLTSYFKLFPKCSLNNFFFIRTCPSDRDVKCWTQDNDSCSL